MPGEDHRGNRVPRHFDSRALQLKIDDAGAQFWSLALEQTQLTYFEVGPHCRFESHSHVSERITLVLEGSSILRPLRAPRVSPPEML
jgi:hypothetical protein